MYGLRLAFAALFVLIFSSSFLAAQDRDIRFQYLIDRDGLPINTVKDIEVDDEGFLWMATDAGLVRYDGSNFKVFIHEPDDPYSRSHTQASFVTKDPSGDLWIGGFWIDHFDKELEQFHTIELEDGSTSFLEDSYGNKWIGTWTKLLMKTPGDASYHVVPVVGQNSVTELYEDSRGLVWIGLFGRLIKYDPVSKLYYEYHVGIINAMTEDSEGNFWLGTAEGLRLFDRDTGEIIEVHRNNELSNSLSSDRITALLEDRKGSLWVGTTNGLNLFQEDSKDFIRFMHDDDDPLSISANYIHSLAEDLAGNIWIATQGGGVNLIRSFMNPFHTFRNDPNNILSLSHNTVSSFFERSDGRIWVGTVGGGLNLFDRKTGTFERFPTLNEENTIINSIIEDKEGYVWVMTTMGGFRVLPNLEKAVFEKQTMLELGIIWNFFQDKDQDIWISSSEGLWWYDFQDARYIEFSDPPQAYSCNQTPDGTLYVASEHGLFKFDPEVNEFIHLLEPGLVALVIDQYGDLIVGSLQGMYYYDPAENVTTPLLRYSEINAIGGQTDSSNSLWIATHTGLYYFNPKTGEKKRYTVVDGLQGNEFHIISNLKASTGELYFGGYNGFTVFHPDSITVNPYVPPVYITNFLLSNQEVRVGRSSDSIANYSPLEQSILYTNEIVLPYSDNVFSFEFAALNYDNPSKNQYKYRLSGFNDDWIFTDASNRLATYTNLSPGSYVFTVAGSNNDGVWNEGGRSINITILPPWWLTWWAKAIYVFIGLAGIWGIVHARTLKQKRKIKAIQEINKATGKFVPYKFLRYLGKESILDVKAGDQTLQEVSVLFCDIRDYTSFSEEMSPEDNFKFINSFVTRIVPIIEENQGFINQFMGDGIMAIFPKTDSGMRAAVQIQQEIERYNIEREQKGKKMMKVGVGLHTGPLIMGIIGTESRSDPSTISDAVNVASRLEGMTKYYGCRIVVSEDTLHKISLNAFNYRYLGEVVVKGKKIPVKVYECFDADAPETVRLKKETRADFDKALEDYHHQRFSEACVGFKRILRINPRDLTASYFLERASTNLKKGVAEGWTGVEKLEYK